jgi:hypothetical protein
MKDWATPRSEWILLHEYNNGKWNQHAKDLFPSRDYDARYKGPSYELEIEYGKLRLRFRLTDLYTPHGDFYYNTSLNIGLLIRADVAEWAKGIDEIIGPLQRFCETHLSGGRSIGAKTKEELVSKLT